MMNTKLNIAYLQLDLVWEDAAANREKIEGLLAGASDGIDLVVLPEMFTTGFSMNPEPLYETMDGTTIRWMHQWARKLDAVVTGSLIVKENHHYMNRLIWMRPDGAHEQYDKRHLFRMGEEHDAYYPGHEYLVTSFRDWRFKPLICYDLRFPVWSRNRNDYDVLIYIANWPESRRKVWRHLLMARAIENLSYVIGVNRVGKDGRDLSYSGDSVIVDPRGEIVSSIEPYEERIQVFQLDLQEILRLKDHFPAHLDADDFELK
jgi:predicted amidohydrolase